MKNLTNPFWAFMFSLLGVGLLVIALYHPNAPVGVLMAVTSAGASLITGGFAYLQGHKDGVTSVSVPTQPSPTSSTTVSVGASDNPTQAGTVPPSPQQ